MSLNHNIGALASRSSMYNSSYNLNKSIERLSTGLRINRASDDASGLAISEKLRAQVKGLGAANKNAKTAINVLSIAEGALNEVSAIAQRMRELSVQAADDSLTSEDRGYLNQEFDQLKSEITRISDTTEFNGSKLLDGTFSNKDFQIGANNSTNDRLNVSVDDLDSTAIGIGNSDISSKANAQAAIDALDSAINSVNSQRSDIGAYVNRLEHTITNNDLSALNTQAAESAIRDVDIGEELANKTKNEILMQAGQMALQSSFQQQQMIGRLLG